MQQIKCNLLRITELKYLFKQIFTRDLKYNNSTYTNFYAYQISVGLIVGLTVGLTALAAILIGAFVYYRVYYKKSILIYVFYFILFYFEAILNVHTKK